ncbi:hypothetical protein pipiens_020281, partial [Culex pipiens pipiens]
RLPGHHGSRPAGTPRGCPHRGAVRFAGQLRQRQFRRHRVQREW